METNNNKNSISLLKEYHDRIKKQSNIEEPSYSCLPKMVNGFVVDCSYKGFKTKGVGVSKSNAKCEAATQMLLNLNYPHRLREESQGSSSSSLCSVTQMKDREFTQNSYLLPITGKLAKAATQNSYVLPITEKLAKAFLLKYPESKRDPAQNRYPPTSADLQVCFSDINFGMKSPNSPKSETLVGKRNQNMHSIECFEKVMGELQLKFCCEQVEIDPSAGNVHVILLKIDFNCMVVGGIGSTISEAVENACRNGLDSFRLYMK